MRRGHHSTRQDDATNDPADWNRSSQESHPIDLLEPEPSTPSDYREASLVFLRVLLMIDTHMSRTRDARLAWVAVSVALGLTSTRGKTLTQLATEMGVSKQALSRPTAKLLRTTGLDPAFGLKSSTARRNYQECH